MEKMEVYFYLTTRQGQIHHVTISDDIPPEDVLSTAWDIGQGLVPPLNKGDVIGIIPTATTDPIVSMLDTVYEENIRDDPFNEDAYGELKVALRAMLARTPLPQQYYRIGCNEFGQENRRYITRLISNNPRYRLPPSLCPLSPNPDHFYSYTSTARLLEIEVLGLGYIDLVAKEHNIREVEEEIGTPTHLIEERVQRQLNRSMNLIAQHSPEESYDLGINMLHLDYYLDPLGEQVGAEKRPDLVIFTFDFNRIAEIVGPWLYRRGPDSVSAYKQRFGNPYYGPQIDELIMHTIMPPEAIVSMDIIPVDWDEIPRAFDNSNDLN